MSLFVAAAELIFTQKGAVASIVTVFLGVELPALPGATVLLNFYKSRLGRVG